MSRGPGSRERQILAALEERPPAHLLDLLPPPHTRAQYAAIHRAAMSLARKGRIVSRGLGWVTRLGYAGELPLQRSRYDYVSDGPGRWRERLRLVRRLLTDEEYNRLEEEHRRWRAAHTPTT